MNFIKVEDNELKSVFTELVLNKLPEWFGNKDALDDYIVKVAELPYWAALNEAGECIGFFSVKIHYGHTGDIFVCGVDPKYHRCGIGKTLYYLAEAYLLQQGCRYIIVKTLSNAVEYLPYDKTREFYKKVGFEFLVTLTEMWDEDNPCLIMIKSFES